MQLLEYPEGNMVLGSKSKGFTLIELLVVIAIIAILAAILMPVFSQAKERTRMTHCITNLRQIGTGLSMYQSDYSYYPPFLASMYGGYIKSKNAYICRSDRFKGKSPFAAADWENGEGFRVVWNMQNMGCSYPYMPRASFWHVDNNGKHGMWRGESAATNASWVNTKSWEQVFDHFTPIVFCWWHAQDDKDATTTLHPMYKKKAHVLMLITGGSVLRCDHERIVPCMAQIGTAKTPREVLH
jgi:prepilin-type N-terminal cleavage/methylation domain-containing protein